MEIRIFAFGQTADIIGRPEIQLSGITDTDELKIRLAEMFQGITTIKYSIAVNKILVQNNLVLRNGDTVALLPPFSGG